MKVGTDIEFGSYIGIFTAPLVKDIQHRNLIGNDHMLRITEVRPLPVDVVIGNKIFFKRKTLEDSIYEVIYRSKVKIFQLLTNHYVMPCGCHIHFDCDFEKSKVLFTNIAEILIKHLGKLNPDVRINSKFNKPDSYKQKLYGIEFRVLPCTLLFHPGLLNLLTLAICSVMKSKKLLLFEKLVKEISKKLGDTSYVDEEPLPAYFSKGGIYTLDEKLNLIKLKDSDISIFIGKVDYPQRFEKIANSLDEALKISKDFQKFIQRKRLYFEVNER